MRGSETAAGLRGCCRSLWLFLLGGRQCLSAPASQGGQANAVNNPACRELLHFALSRILASRSCTDRSSLLARGKSPFRQELGHWFVVVVVRVEDPFGFLSRRGVSFRRKGGKGYPRTTTILRSASTATTPTANTCTPSRRGEYRSPRCPFRAPHPGSAAGKWEGPGAVAWGRGNGGVVREIVQAESRSASVRLRCPPSRFGAQVAVKKGPLFWMYLGTAVTELRHVVDALGR